MKKTLALLLAMAFLSLPVYSAETLAFDIAKTDATKQGNNGFYYQYYTGDEYVNLDTPWETNMGFRLGQSFTIVAKNMIHPGQSEDSVLTWIAPYDGLIEIGGSVRGTVTGSDGVNAKLLSGDSVVWGPQLMVNYNKVNIKHRQVVMKGMPIRLVINCNMNTGSDSTMYTFKVKYLDFVKSEAEDTKTGSSYPEKPWIKPENNELIKGQTVDYQYFPLADAMLKFSGKVMINDGDCKFSVLKNGEVIVNPRFINAIDFKEGYSFTVEEKVKQDDKIAFRVECLEKESKVDFSATEIQTSVDSLVMYKVFINGAEIKNSIPPKLVGNSADIFADEILSELGYKKIKDDNNQKTYKNSNNTLVFTNESDIMLYNGVETKMARQASLSYHYLYIPAEIVTILSKAKMGITDNAIYYYMPKSGEIGSDLSISDFVGEGYKKLQAAINTAISFADYTRLIMDGSDFYIPKDVKKYAIFELDGVGNMEIVGNGSKIVLNPENTLFSIINSKNIKISGLEISNDPYPFITGTIIAKKSDGFIIKVDENMPQMPNENDILIKYGTAGWGQILVSDQSGARMNITPKNIVKNHDDYKIILDTFSSATILKKVNTGALVAVMPNWLKGYGNIKDKKHSDFESIFYVQNSVDIEFTDSKINTARKYGFYFTQNDGDILLKNIQIVPLDSLLISATKAGIKQRNNKGEIKLEDCIIKGYGEMEMDTDHGGYVQ